jgi:hypothetical protein
MVVNVEGLVLDVSVSNSRGNQLRRWGWRKVVANTTHAGTGSDGVRPVHPETATESAQEKLEGTGMHPIDDRGGGGWVDSETQAEHQRKKQNCILLVALGFDRGSLH